MSKFNKLQKLAVSVQDFPIQKNWTYLNAANVSPTYTGSTNAGIKWQTDLQINGAINFNEYEEENVHIPLKKSASKLLNTSFSNIAVASSSTELLNNIAWALSPILTSNTNIVSTAISFPSIVYPFKRISMNTNCQVRLAPYNGDNLQTNIEDIECLIDVNTKILILSHAEYISGQLYDINKLSKHAKDVTNNQCITVIDATQSLGCIPIDINNNYLSDIDILVSASYKWLCSSFGAAIMYIKPELSETLSPAFFGFRSNKNMWDLNAERIELYDNATKFEYATMHFASSYALSESINFLLDIGIHNIYNYDMYLANMLIRGLQNMNNIQIISPDPPQTPIVTIQFNIDGIDTDNIISQLKSENIIVSKRGGIIRISPHLYNTESDIHRFLLYIEKLTKFP